MTKILLTATTALTLMMGIAVAQTTETTTTTTESTSAVPVVPVVPPMVIQNSKQRTVDQFGNVTEHSRSVTQGTAMSPFGDTVTTRRTTTTDTTNQ